MHGGASRSAGLAGESFGFSVLGELPGPDTDVAWSGGGDPATGAGRTFATVLATGGTHTVTARCNDERVAFEVIVCPVDEWLAGARAFYGPSVDFSRVVIGTSKLVLGPPRTGWTCNNVIRFKRPRDVADFPSQAVLIHELAHVWQHQSGQPQLLRGLVEQVARRIGRADPYDYGGPGGVKAAGTLTDLGLEGQAQVVTEYWKSQNGHAADRKGVPFTTPGYVEDLRRLVVGAGIGERRSSALTRLWVLDMVAARLVNTVLARVD
jgi:hypothetical protein